MTKRSFCGVATTLPSAVMVDISKFPLVNGMRAAGARSRSWGNLFTRRLCLSLHQWS